MPLVNAGRDLISAAIVGGTYTAFNNANSYLGVGDSTAVFAVAQTDLQASTNKLRKAMDATYPTQVANVLTFRSTFASADANYAWQEVAVFNASSVGTMLSRVVTSLGTKASGSTWVLTLTLTITV